MNYDQVRDLLVTQWTYTGGPNEAKASEFYHDDALLELPQSGERFQGKERFTTRPAVPGQARVRAGGASGGDLWVAETGLRYDGGEPLSVVKILQFRGDKIERGDALLAEPFPAPTGASPMPPRATSRTGAAPPASLLFRRELTRLFAVHAEAGLEVRMLMTWRPGRCPRPARRRRRG